MVREGFEPPRTGIFNPPLFQLSYRTNSCHQKRIAHTSRGDPKRARLLTGTLLAALDVFPPCHPGSSSPRPTSQLSSGRGEEGDLAGYALALPAWARIGTRWVVQFKGRVTPRKRWQHTAFRVAPVATSRPTPSAGLSRLSRAPRDQNEPTKGVLGVGSFPSGAPCLFPAEGFALSGRLSLHRFYSCRNPAMRTLVSEKNEAT